MEKEDGVTLFLKSEVIYSLFPLLLSLLTYYLIFVSSNWGTLNPWLPPILNNPPVLNKPPPDPKADCPLSLSSFFKNSAAELLVLGTYFWMGGTWENILFTFFYAETFWLNRELDGLSDGLKRV